MKFFITVLPVPLALGLALILAACGNGERNHNNHADTTSLTTAKAVPAAEEYYTCPMHPSVRSDKPGACPVCGMALVKKSAMKDVSDEEMKTLKAITLSPTQQVLANVSTQMVERQSVQKTISAVGIVDVAETHQTTIAARFRGRIEKLAVSYTGETVEKGQMLFELYSPDLVSSEQEYILALKGNQQELITSIHSRLKTHFGMTEEQIAELEQTKQVRTTLPFYSPMTGTVVLKQVVEGQYVDEGTVLYQLAHLSTVWIYLDVYEKDIRFVKTGQPVFITSDAYPNETFSGRVTFIDPVMNPETRTARVRTEFDNRHGRLKPKMYVEAAISVPGSRSIIVPSSAVLFTGKRAVIWVETKKNTFEPRTVTLGSSTDSYYEILNGISEGETIAATGGFLIDSESALQQPGGTSPHAELAKMESTSTTKMKSASKVSSISSQNIHIRVNGTYKPDVVHVKLGQKVNLQFFRTEESQCTAEVIFDELKIRKKLPANKTTIVSITASSLGEIHFSCGEGMVHGKLIVEAP